MQLLAVTSTYFIKIANSILLFANLSKFQATSLLQNALEEAAENAICKPIEVDGSGSRFSVARVANALAKHAVQLGLSQQLLHMDDHYSGAFYLILSYYHATSTSLEMVVS